MKHAFMRDLSFNEKAVGSQELGAAFAEHPPVSRWVMFTEASTPASHVHTVLPLSLALAVSTATNKRADVTSFNYTHNTRSVSNVRRRSMC
jgi:hypothetical protein